MKDRESIIIYRLGSLGDTVVALPALRVVARAFSRERRLMLTNFNASTKAAPMEAVLEGTELVHDYIEYPIGLRNPGDLLELRRRIRDEGVHTLVDLTEPRGLWRAWRDRVFFRACGIRRFIGAPLSPSAQHPRRVPGGVYESQAAALVRRVAELGEAQVDDAAAFDLRLTTEEHAQAAAILWPLADCALIAVSVGAKVDVKDWEDARWRPLLAELARRYPAHGLVALGSADEAVRCEKLCASWRGRFVNACGRLSVRASGAALARCILFVGHDSGPMHLAATVGTHCVAVFSSRNLPGEWFPCGTGHHVLYRPMSCQGCHREVCIDRQKACIRSITAEEMLAAIAAALDANAPVQKVESVQRLREESGEAIFVTECKETSNVEKNS